MVVRLLFMLFAFFPLFVGAQGIVIDVEYQPHTTYEWTRALSYDQTLEFIGAEDMGDFLQQLGMEPYSESQRSRFIKVKMTSADWNDRKLYCHIGIDSVSINRVSSTPDPNYWSEPVALEIEDISIHGVINHFHKIEIDSINGVDSLAEKNRVFTLLDDIHRSWTYPSDTLIRGVPLEKTAPYIQSSRIESSAQLKTTYLLEQIDDDVAHIRMDFVIVTSKEKDNGQLMDGVISEGSGTGLLLYDIKQKQVILHEYTRDEKSFNEIMELSVESTSTST